MARKAAKDRTPTSATGTSTARSRGFTLVEILVVLLIIGLVATGAVLSLGVVGGGDRPLAQERERLQAATAFLREQASLQNREFGLRCFPGGYEFVVFDAGGSGWMRITDERLVATHKLPPGIEVSLRIDGRPVVLPKPDATDPVPQVLLSASGDLNLFELTVRRENGGPGFRASPAQTEDEITFTTLDAGATG